MDQPMPNADAAVQPNATMQQPGQPPQGAMPAKGSAQSRLASLVIAAKKVVFDKTMSANLMKMIQGAPDPVQGIVQALHALIPELGQKFGGLDDATSTILAAYISAMLIELCVAAGLIPKDPRAIAVVVKAVADGFKGGGEQTAQQPAPQPQGSPPAEAQPQEQGLVAQTMEG